MSLPATTSTQPPATADIAELRAVIEQLGRKLDEARQELKSDIQSKLPTSRRFSWVLLFIAVQVVQGIIVVRYTVRAASTALDSANIPEMTARYSEALHQSRALVTNLNQNVGVLSGLVGETTDAWKKHVQGFVRELPKVQEGYERAATKFSAEASALPSRIVDRFFEADDVKRSMAMYTASVDVAASSVQQRSDDALVNAMKAYEGKITSAEALAHFEKQVEHKFEQNKERIADSVAAGMGKAVESAKLQEKLAGFWDASLKPGEAGKPAGWLYEQLHEQAGKAPIEATLVKAVDAAALPPLQKWFSAQLEGEGALAKALERDQDKVPAMPQLVTELVRKQVEASVAVGDGEKLPRLDEVLRDVVKSQVNVRLSALAPAKGPVVLTCK